ncbi:site-2 protease family protein [Candidatus Saccharibacteria bacterium]|nr:site-2 protease family protein [Candidatus Saccharibacteria bacterium]
METILFIVGIILFILLVVIHELGHAIAAQRNGVVVEEFGIGFPPKAWGKKLKNGVLFTLNWLPLGGFVKLKGETDDARGKGTYGAAPLAVKAKILLAGVVMNWVTAVLIFTILAVTGMPRLVPGQFTVAADTRVVSQPVVALAVEKGSPADKAGIRDGDTILAINGQAIASDQQLRDTTKANTGQTVKLTYARDGAEKTVDVALRDQKTGQLGVAPFFQEMTYSTWSAPLVGVGLTAQLSAMTVEGVGKALWNLVAGLAQKIIPSEQVQKQANEALTEAGGSVAGPVGIINLLQQVAKNMGLAGVMLIIAVISLTLAVMNVLPIPALDGGRLFVTLLFRGLKKPLRRETEEKIHGTGFIVLMLLFVVITVLDVSRLAR